MCAAAHVPDLRKTCQSKNRAVRHLEPAGQTATIIMSGTPCYLYMHPHCDMKYRSHTYKVIVGEDNDTRNVLKYASICSASSSNILHYITVNMTFTLIPLIFPYKIPSIPICMAKTVFLSWSVTLQCIKIRF